MRRKIISCSMFILICFGFTVNALSENMVDLEEEKARLMKDAGSERTSSFPNNLATADFLDRMKEKYEKKIHSPSERAELRSTWFSKDPADLAPLLGTIWEFYYMFSSGLQTDSILFGNSVQTSSDGTVGLLCVNDKGKLGAVFYTSFPSSLGGGRGFSAMIDWGSVDIQDFYFFKVSGSSASGYFMFQLYGDTSKVYSMTGTKDGGSTTTTTTSPTTTSTTTSTTTTTPTTTTSTTTTIPPIVTEYPVYRFFSTETNTHFFTISEEEMDTIIDNYPWYRYEGIAWYAYPPGYQESNTYPVYRFFSTETNTHFFTISEEEMDTIIDNYPWYRYEGIAWYAYPPGYQESNTYPVYRFFSTETNTHFFTISEEEMDTIIDNYPWYRYEGIAWYAYPPG